MLPHTIEHGSGFDTVWTQSGRSQLCAMVFIKHRFQIIVALTLLSLDAIADRPNLNKYSDAELWEAADLVALIRVESGEYKTDVGFDLTATPLAVLKGGSDSSIAIAAHYPLLDAPSQLGSTYLVFLSESGAGSFKLIHELRSSVKILYVEPDDDMAVRINAPSPSKEDKDWYSVDGALWVVDCSPLYAYPIGHYCIAEKSIVTYAMDRLGGIKESSK